MPRGKPPKVPLPKGAANPGSRQRRKETGSGRRPGVQNKVTRDMREAILNAFERLGGENYLIKNARDFRTLGGLFKAVIPQELKITPNADEVSTKIRERMGAMDEVTQTKETKDGSKKT